MDLRQLRYFARIVELGSMTRAAADLHVAQPALSKSVLALEAELKAVLLIRSPHGVTPTDAGLRLYEHAQIILNQLERARIDLSDVGTGPSGRVTVGMSYSVAAVLAVPLLRAAQHRLPKVRLEMFQEPRQSLPDRILSGRIDLGVMVYPKAVVGIEQTTLVSENILFVCAPDLAATLPEPVPLQAIADLPFILPTRANSLRVLVDSLFLIHGKPLNVVHEVDAIGQFIDCVRAGLASTFLPAGCVGQAVQDGAVATRPIGGHTLSRSVAIAHSQSNPTGRAVVEVMNLLRELMEKAVADGTWAGARWVAP
jgi:DNA-binding transcriptional LysR family regulator